MHAAYARRVWPPYAGTNVEINIYEGMKNARTPATDPGIRGGKELDRVLWTIAAVISGAIVYLAYTL